jgi:hypothetical protein
MSNPTITRLLGIALIAGGTIVGIVLILLTSNYVSGGTLSTTTATLAVIVSFLFLVLPQIGLGAYLIWHSMQKTAVSHHENPSSTE